MKVINDIVYSDPFRESFKNHIMECYRPKEKSLGNRKVDDRLLTDVREIEYIGAEHWQEIFEMLGGN